MSDRFNESYDDKVKITALVAPDNEYDISTVDVETFFPQFKDKSPPRMSALEFAQLLSDKDIVAYKPMAIPTLVFIPAEGLINDGLLALTYNRKDKSGTLMLMNDGKINLPVGDTEFLPEYNPNHQSQKYDRKFFNQLIYQYLEHPNLDYYKDWVTACLKIPRQYVFSSGTYNGQINRLKAMYQINLGLHGKRKPISVLQMLPKDLVQSAGSDLEAVALILEYYLPLNTVEDYMDGGFPGLLHYPSYFANLSEDDTYDYLPTIGKDRLAGLPYVGSFKREVVPEALALADIFMRRLSAIIASSTPEANNPLQGLNIPHATKQGQTFASGRRQVEELLNEMWYLGAGLLFPKAERYSLDDLENKTRNIYASSFPIHIIASLISNPVLEFSPNMLHGDTPSLYAFSPWHGGMDVFVDTILNAQESTSWIYADNWYVIYKEDDGTYTYFSIDQEKAESQVQFDDFRAAAYYMLSRGHITKEGEPAFNLTWLYMATSILPTLFSDPVALLKAQQFLVRGMGSGIAWTFIMNHIRSAVIDSKWRRQGKPRPGTKEFESKVLEPAKCNLKIELELKDVKGALLRLKDDTPEDGYFQLIEPSGPSSKPVPYVKLDMLGWGAAYSRAGDMYLPVLDEERMMKSLMLPQKDDETDFKDQPFARPAYEVARCEAMRMAGAWRIGVADRALTAIAVTERRKLLKMGELSRDKLDKSFKMTEFGQEFNLAELGINLVKPIEYSDLVLLHVDNNSAKDEIKRRILSDGPVRWDYGSLVQPPARAVKLKGISLLASYKIDELVRNKNILGSDIDPKQLQAYYRSQEYRDSAAELQSFKNYLRNRVEPPSVRATRTRKPEELANPFVELGLHSDHMVTGATKSVSAAGPKGIFTTGVMTALSKNQRRKDNKFNRANIPPTLIEGFEVGSARAPTTTVDKPAGEVEHKQPRKEGPTPAPRQKDSVPTDPRLNQKSMSTLKGMSDEDFLKHVTDYAKAGGAVNYLETAYRFSNRDRKNLMFDELEDSMGRNYALQLQPYTGASADPGKP